MNKTYKMEDQSKLRSKYQQKDGAAQQLLLFGKKKSEMSDAERVFSLQCKLYQKAKQEKRYKYKRKSQRKCRLYGQKAFEVLVERYGLIDPTKYTSGGVRL